jgi:tetratricopeptide (TPR) repeat protein
MHPIQADMIYKLGSSWRQQDLWTVAVSHDEWAIELDPRQDQYYLYLAMDLQKQVWDQAEAAPLQEALIEFERAARQAQTLNPLATDHSVNLARVYQTWWQSAAEPETKQLMAERTSSYYETALRLSPNNALIWNQWAQYLVQTNNLELAQEKLDSSFDLDSEFDETWIIQANLYTSQGLMEEAIEAYQQALEIAPRRTDVRLHLGDMYANENRHADAIDAYRSALEIQPRLNDAWLRIGDVYVLQNVITDAIAAYEQAIQIKPGQTNVWIRLGELYAQQNLTSNAISAYERALELDPENANVWLRLGDTYLGDNRLEEAASSYERALELNPEHAQAWRVLGGYVYVNLERLEDAAAAMERALELEPGYEDAWDIHRVLAIVYNDLGMGNLALSHALAALEMVPEEQRATMENLVAQLSSGASQ